MRAIRYLTTVSGFLNVRSEATGLHMEFDPLLFFIPQKDWKAPYPYCLDDVLFPVEQQDQQYQISQQPPRSQFAAVLTEQILREQSAVTVDSNEK